jgi:hypothetical protein
MFGSNRTNHAFPITLGIIASTPFSGFAEKFAINCKFSGGTPEMQRTGPVAP